MVRQRENGHDLGWEYFLCLTLRIFVMDNTNLTYIISLLSSKAGTDKRKKVTHTYRNSLKNKVETLWLPFLLFGLDI